MGFALFTTPFAIAAKDALQEMVFDEESKSVLHTDGKEKSICQKGISVMSKPIWKQVDPRFVWNRNILEELIENKLDGFIIPLLQGNILKLFNAYFVCVCARMCLCMSTCVRVKGIISTGNVPSDTDCSG
ncbi:phosphatidylinositide phosphatase SAC2-like [Camellia sinensis]|uniref:phosphatidylinositide phosphatase SAC2-like n=1 Tax=Camellia sinensis TaxID=4442 RepID=UPI00103660BD|nr:phosphatidylinositide phosphatase SAC2-like [Camellia sinensis]